MRIRTNTVSPHMIILEEPCFMPAGLQLLKPLSQTSRVTEKKTNSTYFPICNSYPRIAPHPTKKPTGKSLSNQGFQNLSKRMCTERKIENTSVARGLSEERHRKQQKLVASNSVLLSPMANRNSLSSSTFTASSTNPGSPSISSLHTSSSDPPDGGSCKKITTSTHHLRFLNTVKLLRQSDLLDITLRTKELLHQSKTTEQDISQLRQHTELLCRAVSNPRQSLNGVTAWDHVWQAMANSGSYPNLKIIKSQNPSQLNPGSQIRSISSGDMNIIQTAEDPCLLKQDEKLETRESSLDRAAMMSPDSSTG